MFHSYSTNMPFIFHAARGFDQTAFAAARGISRSTPWDIVHQEATCTRSDAVYIVLVLLMICNRNGITSVGRWEFVKAFVEDFVAILVAIHFATPFATKNDRENFVEISSKISLLQLKFDEIWTNCLTKFWRFFFVAKCCGKTFCHNILPQNKIVKISSKISLLQFMTKS